MGRSPFDRRSAPLHGLLPGLEQKQRFCRLVVKQVGVVAVLDLTQALHQLTQYDRMVRTGDTYKTCDTDDAKSHRRSAALSSCATINSKLENTRGVEEISFLVFCFMG